MKTAFIFLGLLVLSQCSHAAVTRGTVRQEESNDPTPTPTVAAPQFPQLPGLPQLPAFPQIPGFPQFPGLPAFPGLPQLPAFPSLPAFINPFGGDQSCEDSEPLFDCTCVLVADGEIQESALGPFGGMFIESRCADTDSELDCSTFIEDNNADDTFFTNLATQYVTMCAGETAEEVAPPQMASVTPTPEASVGPVAAA